MRLVKAKAIKNNTEKPLLAYLRQNKLVMAFICEIRNIEFDSTGKPLLNLNSFEWDKSIRGFDFWHDVDANYKWFTHHYLMINKKKYIRRTPHASRI